jgi:hypothetical protein
MGVRRDKARNTSQQKCVPGHRLILVSGWESNQPVEALDAQIGGEYGSLQSKTKWMI